MRSVACPVMNDDRPADTLYSAMYFDVSKEPMIFSVPDSGGRYYLLQMLDMWTDVFAAPGKRTTGTGAQTFAVTGPGWQIPPVRGFWWLTMYDQRELFAGNLIDRYAIGDRDKLRFNPDGSLDLYIQRKSPGKDRKSNWLPAPASGPFR